MGGRADVQARVHQVPICLCGAEGAIEIAKDEPEQDVLVSGADPKPGPGGFGQVDIGGL